MKNIYKTLEFDEIKNILKKYARTESGIRVIANLQMFTLEGELEDELSLTKEMLSYCYKYQVLLITPHKDISLPLEMVRKNGVGNLEFFYQIQTLLQNSKDIKEQSQKDSNYPLIMEMIHSLDPLEQFIIRLDHVIERDLTMKDTASSELKAIRRSLINEKASQTKIMSQLVLRYKNIMNDGNVALKNDAFVLPVKTSYKNKVDGIIVDISDTGLTTFIEPLEIVESNNKIIRLLEKEKEEMNRILASLSDEVRKFYDVIKKDFDLITRLDFLTSKAMFGMEYDCQVAKLSNNAIIRLQGVRHPLIDKKVVVKNSFILDKQKIMLITGPNAGGKTVALKVVGLMIVMNQCGLPLPTDEEGELGYFKKIFVDIGDNQSLLDNLSTFSGHIKNVVEMVNTVDSRSLVLIDELGTGTSPLDGEAIGIGVIDYLHKMNCFALISSHYEGLKTYALEHDYILNASMVFDEEKLLPTYRLRLGVAGKSYGIEVARRLGLKDEVLETSVKYLHDRKLNDKEITIEQLQHKLEENDLIKQELLNKQEELKEKEQELVLEMNKTKKMRQDIYLDADKEKEELIKEAKNQIDQIIMELKNSNDYKMPKVIKTKHDLDMLLGEEEQDDFKYAEVQVGDTVEVTSSGIRGTIKAVKGENLIIESEYGMSINAKRNQVIKIKPIVKKKKKESYFGVGSTKLVKLECNLIGMRVEEALDELAKYLDDAMLVHYKTVRIIHGSGTGALRKAVHQYLDHDPQVKSYRLGGFNEGGVGATVVEFK